jgi:uncharacterized membrane protein (DUF485 family)
VTRQELSPRAQPEDFDWWAAPERAREQQELKRHQPGAAELELDPEPEPELAESEHAEPGHAEPEHAGPDTAEPEHAGLDSAPPVRMEPLTDPRPVAPDSAGIYREVQAGPQFRQVRSGYRRFVLPATLAFVSWYLAYVVASVAAPDLMDRPVVGPLNVAWVLGLAQFATTFLTAWLYARNARDHRDRAALGLRWDTQDRLR